MPFQHFPSSVRVTSHHTAPQGLNLKVMLNTPCSSSAPPPTAPPYLDELGFSLEIFSSFKSSVWHHCFLKTGPTSLPASPLPLPSPESPGHIGKLTITADRRAGKGAVKLMGRLTNCVGMSPGSDVQLKMKRKKKKKRQTCQFGSIMLTTSAGSMDQEEAKQKHRRDHPGTLYLGM